MNSSQDSLPRRFFREREINDKLGIDSPDRLWEWILAGAPVSRRRGIEPLPPESDRIYYRGQSNEEHNISSSLFRTLQNFIERVSEEDMGNAETRLIREMRNAQGLGRLMTDGQLLAVLQHWGIPTRLIDVSDRPLEALFFAVDHDLGLPGRFFVIELAAGENGRPDTLSLARRQGLAWVSLEPKVWAGRVAVVNPQDLDPRMRAQRGRFLVGGLPSSHERQRMQHEHRGLKVHEFREITNLAIRFPERGTPGRKWPATAWSVRIDSDWKIDLRRRLEKLPDKITADTMYPPINEVLRVARRILGSEARTLHVPRDMPSQHSKD